MDGMNLNGKSKRTIKQKIYSVDTRKPRAAAELSVLTPANGFEEILSSKPLRKAPVHRYFRFLPDPMGGVPKAQLEAAFKEAAAFQASAPVAPPPAGAPQLPPAPSNSQGSYGAMHEDEGIDELATFFAEHGVASQGEFDELAALMEQKAQIGGARRRRTRRSRKSRKSRKHSRR